MVCDFSTALHFVKNGRRMARRGWNDSRMFIFLVPGSRFTVNRPPLLGIYPEGTEIRYHAHIDMRTADGFVVPWLASQTDLLANDWEEVTDIVIKPESDPTLYPFEQSKAAFEQSDHP